jgi:hypothetical protein
MGGNQSAVDETPTSPKSPRVAPVESGETSNIAQLKEQRLEAELAETRKELSEMKFEMMAMLQRVVEKVDA